MERCPLEGRQFADQQLALDLEADKEKEDGHQAVVDPEMPAPSQYGRSEACRNLFLPDCVVMCSHGSWPRRGL